MRESCGRRQGAARSRPPRSRCRARCASASSRAAVRISQRGLSGTWRRTSRIANAEHAAEQEGERASPIAAPSTVGLSSTMRRPAPIAAPIQKVPLIARSTRAAHARRDQLVDRRVDRRVFAADAEAGEEAAERERPEVERERGEHRRDQIDHQRDEEHALAAEAVGQPAEDERAEHRAADVGRGRPADLAGGQAERVGRAAAPGRASRPP